MRNDNFVDLLRQYSFIRMIYLSIIYLDLFTDLFRNLKGERDRVYPE